MLETNASVTSLRSPETRFEASERNATQRGPTSKPPLIAGEYDGPFAAPPLRERETRRILPGLHICPRLSKRPRRRTTNTSRWPFVSCTRFEASDSNAIARAQRRSAEITAWVEGPLPCVICRVFWSRARLEAPVAGASAAAAAAATHAIRRT